MSCSSCTFYQDFQATHWCWRWKKKHNQKRAITIWDLFIFCKVQIESFINDSGIRLVLSFPLCVETLNILTVLPLSCKWVLNGTFSFSLCKFVQLYWWCVFVFLSVVFIAAGLWNVRSLFPLLFVSFCKLLCAKLLHAWREDSKRVHG